MERQDPPIPRSQPTAQPQIYDTWDLFLNYFGGRNIPLPRAQDTNVIGTYCSCGVSMLSGIQEAPEEIVYKVLKMRAHTDHKKIKEAFVVFSDTDHDSCKVGGNVLYQYIKTHKLGNIVEFGPRMNPNTGNSIKLWVWEPPHDSLSMYNRQMPVWEPPMPKPDARFESNLNNSREA